MALNIEVGSFACQAGTGSQTVSLPSGTSPKAVQFWTTGRTANGSGSAHGRFCYGHATDRGGTASQFHWCAATEDAIGTSDCYVGSGTSQCIKLTNGTTATVTLSISFTEFNGDDMVLNVGTAESGVIINYIVWGGSDVEDALPGSTNINNGTTNVTVASGFGQPTIVFFPLSWNGASTPLTGDMGSMFGFGVKSGSANGRCIAIGSQDNAGTQASSQIVSNNRALTAIDAGTLSTNLQISADSAWPTDGFQFTLNSGTFGYPAFWLAIKLSANCTVTTGEGTARTTTGTSTLTCADTPKLALILGTMQTTANTLDTTGATCAEFHIGAIDGDNTERSAGFYDDDGQATSSVTGTWQSDSKAYRTVTTSSDATDSEADGSVNGSNFELNFTDAAASAWIYEYLTVGVAGAGGVALAGAVASASTVSGALSVDKNLAAAVSSASTVSGTLRVAGDLTAAVTSASAVSGTLSIASPLAGAVTSASAVAGTLTVTAGLAGAVASASTVSGTLTNTPPGLTLAGAVSSASTVSGSITVTKDLAGAVASDSTVSGSVTVERPLAGAITSASAVAGTLTNSPPGVVALAGTVASSSTVSGTLLVTKPLAGAIASASTVSATATVRAGLAVSVSSASTVSGALTIRHPLAGEVSSSSTVSGAIVVLRPLAVTVTAASTVSATLTNRGPITSVGRLEGDMTVAQMASGLSIGLYESGGGTPNQEE